MANVADFCLDASHDALICVTQDGVERFGIETGRRETLYTGAADQAALCGEMLLVRAGIILRFALHDGVMYVLDASGTL